MRRDDETVRFERRVKGNSFFWRVVDTDQLLATLLADTLAVLGDSPTALTPGRLSEVLPEVERRMRVTANADHADRSLGRLRSILLAS